MSATLTDLPRIPASDVKTRGWRGVMRAITATGPVVVTNHSEPEAVILSAEDYETLITLVKASESRTEAGLDTLRQRFDERLAVLRQDSAGDRLRAITRRPAKLLGKVKAGASY
jgi:prevent-host-death family protein